MIEQSDRLWTCAWSTLQSNRACQSLLSQNKQTPLWKPRAPMFLRTMWLSWARAHDIAFQGNEGDEKSRILSSIEISFTFPSWWWGKGLVMTFGLAVLSNYTSLLSMSSWIQWLNYVHSSKVCPLAPKWCSHFLDRSKSNRGGLSLGLANIGVTRFFSNR